MKKNFVLKASVAALLALTAASANAGTLAAANTVFATENFGATAPATTSITPGAMTYSMSNSTTINAGSTVYFLIRLTNGKFAAAPAVTQYTVGGAAVEAAPGVAANSVAVAVPTLSTDRTTLEVAITADSAAALQLGLGAFTYTPAAGDIDSVNALATAGATVDATMSVTTVAAASAGALDSTNALATSVDGASPTAAIATSATAITAAVDAAMAGYANKIDLTATPVASAYSLAAKMALGSVTFSNVTGTQNVLGGGATDYTVDVGSAGGATPATATITVTPGTGQAFPIGATLFADKTSSACGASLGGAAVTAAITAATSTTAKTLTIAAADVTDATPIFVCMDAPSATNTASPITATLVGTTVPAAATDAATTVTGTGYAVDYNGSSVDVRNYVPAAVAGWTQYLRVINTGSVSAAVSMATIDEATGAVGTSAVVTTLAPGAATSLSSTQIEAAIGAVAATARPRIRVTAPTNGMDVQNILFTPNGSFTAMQGKE